MLKCAIKRGWLAIKLRGPFSFSMSWVGGEGAIWIEKFVAKQWQLLSCLEDFFKSLHFLFNSEILLARSLLLTFAPKAPFLLFTRQRTKKCNNVAHIYSSSEKSKQFIRSCIWKRDLIMQAWWIQRWLFCVLVGLFAFFRINRLVRVSFISEPLYL